MKSIKSKMLALVLCCIILSAAAIGSASFLNARQAVTKDSTQIMNLLCDNRREEIDNLLERIEQSVKTLMVYAEHQLTDFESFRTDAAYVDSYTKSLLDVAVNAADNTEGALTVYIRFNPDFTDPQSGLFCSRSASDDSFQELTPTNLTRYDSSDTEHVGWFYEPAKRGTGTWLGPYMNENINVKMVSYVVPYYQKNTLVGVVGMDIDFALLQNVVSDTSAYQTGYAFLADDRANIVYHQELAYGTELSAYNEGEFKKLAELIKTGQNTEDSLISYSYQGEQRKATFRQLTNGMRLVLTAPTSEIDEQANWLLWQIVAATLFFVSTAIVVTIVFTRRMIKPLLELNVAARKIADGDLSVTITHQSKDEVGNLAESFRQTVAHLHKYISYINELAYRDSLTGVKNKTAYLEMISQMDQMTRLKRPAYAVVVFDINNLKQLNDSKGHDFGDILICSASKVICKVFKRSPVYRIGGDEFVALLEGADYENYSELLERFQQEIDRCNQAPHNEMKLSIARGIALYSEESDLTYNDVFKRADSAMYRNKQEMKNRME